MFVGSSEISISVIVKYVQQIGIIRAFYLPGGLIKFFSAWGTEKIDDFGVSDAIFFGGKNPGQTSI